MVVNLTCTPRLGHGYAETCRSKVTVVSHIGSAFTWYFRENNGRRGLQLQSRAYLAVEFYICVLSFVTSCSLEYLYTQSLRICLSPAINHNNLVLYQELLHLSLTSAVALAFEWHWQQDDTNSVQWRAVGERRNACIHHYSSETNSNLHWVCYTTDKRTSSPGITTDRTALLDLVIRSVTSSLFKKGLKAMSECIKRRCHKELNIWGSVHHA